MGAGDLLLPLLKAGGLAALAIGVVYLLYSQIIKLGIFPRLKQWQGFALLCLLAILVFIIAMTALRPRTTSPTLDGELPPDNHFQLDATQGVYCENKNVRDDFAQFFDYVEIGLQSCTGTIPNASGSRSYRIIWPPQRPQSIVPESRRNYRQCFVSDLASHAPKLVDDLQNAFQRIQAQVPCQATVSVWRIISLSYTDLRDQSHQLAFGQSYNEGGGKAFGIRQIPTTARVAPADVPNEINVAVDAATLDSEIVEIVKQYRFPNIPRMQGK
jgi:hypothetical protein